MKNETENAYKQAEINKLNAEAEKIRHEIWKDKQTNNKKLTILKYFTGGITIGLGLVPIFLVYFSYVIEPMQAKDKIENETHVLSLNLLSTKLTLKSDSLKKIGQMAIELVGKFELTSEQYEDDKRQLESEKNSLLEQLKNMEIKISNINCDESVKADFSKIIKEKSKKIQESVVESSKDIQQSSDSSIQKIKKDIISLSKSGNLKVEQSGMQGWIYVGHIINGKYGDTNKINIDSGFPKKDKEYLIIKDSFIREGYPNFPLYKIPKSTSILAIGSKILIIEYKNIGRDKIWAKVKVL